jgi:hypothetical protein
MAYSIDTTTPHHCCELMILLMFFLINSCDGDYGIVIVIEGQLGLCSQAKIVRRFDKNIIHSIDLSQIAIVQVVLR